MTFINFFLSFYGIITIILLLSISGYYYSTSIVRNQSLKQDIIPHSLLSYYGFYSFMWIFFPLVIIFAFSMMFAHAFIPSGVDTGLYPQKLSILRIPLTIVGLIALGGAVVLMASVIIQYPDTLRAIWGEMWM